MVQLMITQPSIGSDNALVPNRRQTIEPMLVKFTDAYIRRTWLKNFHKPVWLKCNHFVNQLFREVCEQKCKCLVYKAHNYLQF